MWRKIQTGYEGEFSHTFYCTVGEDGWIIRAESWDGDAIASQDNSENDTDIEYNLNECHNHLIWLMETTLNTLKKIDISKIT